MFLNQQTRNQMQRQCRNGSLSHVVDVSVVSSFATQCSSSNREALVSEQHDLKMKARLSFSHSLVNLNQTPIAQDNKQTPNVTGTARPQ
jgi:hypothetical protein